MKLKPVTSLTLVKLKTLKKITRLMAPDNFKNESCEVALLTEDIKLVDDSILISFEDFPLNLL